MKHIILVILTLISAITFAQQKEDKEALLALKRANDYVYEGNTLAEEDDFISAEMTYRKAISEQSTNVAGAYNLGNSYYKNGNYEEALYRHNEAAKNATSKEEKHKAYHNIGNILMKNKKCKEAVEAFKSALRNDPTDDETRYNLGLAKQCAEQQQGQEGDSKDNQDKEDQDDNKDQDQKENDDKQDKGDDGDEKKEGDDKQDEDQNPKEEKDDKGQGDEKNDENQKQQPQQGQLSPQQIKSLLEAMNNQEQKVQEKMNAEKQKGVKIQTEKDW